MRCTFEVHARLVRVVRKTGGRSCRRGSTDDFGRTMALERCRGAPRGRPQRETPAVAQVGDGSGFGPVVDDGMIGEACGDARCTRGLHPGRHGDGATRRRRSLHPLPRLMAATQSREGLLEREWVAETAVCACDAERTSGFGSAERHPQGVCRHEHPTRSGGAGRAGKDGYARLSAWKEAHDLGRASMEARQDSETGPFGGTHGEWQAGGSGMGSPGELRAAWRWKRRHEATVSRVEQGLEVDGRQSKRRGGNWLAATRVRLHGREGSGG